MLAGHDEHLAADELAVSISMHGPFKFNKYDRRPAAIADPREVAFKTSLVLARWLKTASKSERSDSYLSS